MTRPGGALPVPQHGIPAIIGPAGASIVPLARGNTFLNAALERALPNFGDVGEILTSSPLSDVRRVRSFLDSTKFALGKTVVEPGAGWWTTPVTRIGMALLIGVSLSALFLESRLRSGSEC